MRVGLTIALLVALIALATATHAADATAAQVVGQHFKAIAAEDYTSANALFTEQFLRAFNSDNMGLREYYTTRRQQVRPGWQVLSTTPLVDEGRETAVVTVDFNDQHTDAPLQVTERMYYYLLRVPVKGKAFGAAADGKAWRIDIFDALRFDTLAEARRRPYLYTKEAWPEDAGRELRSRQGLFRIQWALTSHFTEHGAYPATVQGGDDKNEPLIAGGYLPGAYPLSGFSGQPMRAVEFNANSPGDFSYYALDANGDGSFDGYWLLLHGALSERGYFAGYEVIYIASGSASQEQSALAAAFAAYWQQRGGEQLQLTGATSARVASFSLIRPRIEEAPGGWWASVRGRYTGSWVLAGAIRLASCEAGNTLRVHTYGF
ncbi:MAG: hypothetical protein M3R04_00695 [bacterium]|nr:hypothetical protein [bacterium]